MNDDQLRDRIGRLDALPGDASIEPVTSREARALLEDIMNTPLDTPDSASTESPTIGTTAAGPARRNHRRWWSITGAAAAIVAALAVGATMIGGDDDGGEIAAPATTATPTEPAKATVLELTAPGDDIMASCLALDAAILSETPLAFKGTVTMAENGVVQLTIDEAYKGTDAQVATLSAPEGMEALIGGVAWEIGQQYLVSAYDGVVSYCGQTGPATPELQAIYDQAFAA